MSWPLGLWGEAPGTAVSFRSRPAVRFEGSPGDGAGLSIRVRLKAPGIDSLPGQREINLSDGVTLHDLIVRLRAEFGSVVDEGFVAVNSEVVRRDQAVKTRLKDGDEVLLVPPMALG